jgi:hypothetical protein
VLQMTDASHNIIFELHVDSGRELWLYSPPGGLRADSINVRVGATVPNDGISGIAVGVAARANDAVTVSVNGVQTVSLDGLRGATTDPPRFLATGIVGFSPRSDAGSVTTTHTQISVSPRGDTEATKQPAPAPAASGPAAPAPTPRPSELRALRAPTIRGRAEVGGTLTADAGSWTESAPAFAYSWERCDAAGSCTTIEGATTDTYVLAPVLRGEFVRVRVTATVGSLRASAVSVAAGPVEGAPVAATAPTIAGAPIVGGTLTADAGAWSDPAASFGYVWQRCDVDGVCTTIEGATGSSYSPGADDLGRTLRVTVTASNAVGSGSASSPASEPVHAQTPPPTVGLAPTVISAPTLAGDATVGAMLTASPGDWSDPAASFGYVWQRCDVDGVCTTIEGATGSSYSPGADDLGRTLRVTVTATTAAGAVGTADSSVIGPVLSPAPVAPSTTGNAISAP